MSKNEIKIKFISFITVIICINLSITYAAGVTVPSWHTVNINNNTVNIAGDMNNSGTLQLGTKEITLGGDWFNNGVVS